MKAILVIDMPSDMRIEETKALYITLFNGMIVREYTLDCPLRPLPSFKAVDLNDTRDVIMFCHGWNTCLDEITGETE